MSFFKPSPTPIIDGKYQLPNTKPCKWILGDTHPKYTDRDHRLNNKPSYYETNILVENDNEGAYKIVDGEVKLIPNKSFLLSVSFANMEKAIAVANELIELHNKAIQ